MEIIGWRNADVAPSLLDRAGDNRSDGGDCRAPKSFLQYYFAQPLLSHLPQALFARDCVVDLRGLELGARRLDVELFSIRQRRTDPYPRHGTQAASRISRGSESAKTYAVESVCCAAV
jgi:hypothetical protein